MPDDSFELAFNAPATIAAGFTQVPNWILRHPDLGISDKLVYAALLSYAWNRTRRQTFAGQDTIAADIGVSVATVRRSMQALRKAGLLVSRRRMGKRSLHTLQWCQDAMAVISDSDDGHRAGEMTVIAPTRSPEEDEQEEDEDLRGGGTVVHAEVVSWQHVDEVIEHFNATKGSAHRTGPGRDKATSEAIRARLRDEAKLDGIDMALRRAKAIIDEKARQTIEPGTWDGVVFAPGQFKLSVLFRAKHWAEYLEEARSRKQNGKGPAIRQRSDLAAWAALKAKMDPCPYCWFNLQGLGGRCSRHAGEEDALGGRDNAPEGFWAPGWTP